MKKIPYTKLLSLFCLMFLLSTCDVFENTGTGIPDESEKNIAGVWKIAKVIRNEVDITALMDFNQFRIRFNADNTYTIAHYLPFIVKENGTWSLDDPQYPFHLNLTENGSANVLTTAFNYPVTGGKRIITLSFSPGCQSNIYTYTFEKTSEN
jgi:hypothetical protein